MKNAILSLPEQSPQFISTITMGELKFGLENAKALGQTMDHIETCLRHAEDHPPLPITRHTATAYAMIRSKIAQKHMDLRRKLPRWIDEWVSRINASKLQVDENDLWIAAQALELNLVVITRDQQFNSVIADAVPAIRVQLLS